MSDIYPVRDPLVNICDPPTEKLKYVLEQRKGGNEVVLWLAIRYEAIIRWHKIKEHSPEVKYIDLLNELIPGNAFKIDRESKRIGSRLCACSGEISKKQKILNRGGSHSKREDHVNNFYKLAVLKSEIISVDKWEAELHSVHLKLKQAQMDIGNWRKKYQDLEKEKETLAEEMLSELENNCEEKQEKIKELEKENEQLLKYIDILENEKLGHRRGATIPELKTKQAQNRKLKQLKTRAQKALHFVEIFGLELQFLKLKDPQRSQTFTMDFRKQNDGVAPKSNYQSLSSDDRSTLESILFLMDKFGVGDEFIHELTMVVKDFPVKSYLIKQLRSELNKQVNISTTPGQAPGAQHSFKELLADKVREMKNEASLKSEETVKVKLSGDGARMTHLTNFILMSFSILQQVDDVLASKGNHTIAVINGSESRKTIEESFADVFREVNQVIEDGFIEVDGERVGVEIFLGGDYKFLLLVMGLSAANSTYACLWCKVHKKDRGDMSKTDKYYNNPPLRRTIDEMKELVSKKKGENYCCCYKPLLNIPLDNIILDELHLMLRITDILLKNLIEDAMQWDDKESSSSAKKRSVENSNHVKQLVQQINKCGVSFSIWEKRNADGKGSGTWDWTSLMGDDRKKLLKVLPERLASSNDCIQQDTSQMVVLLWKNFADLYFNYISSWVPFTTDVYREQIKEWIESFSKLGEKRTGYRKENVTCYMHSAAYHIPQMVERNQNIKQFSGQGVEKNNDDARRIVQRKSNHSDDPAEVLKTEHRLGVLRRVQRVHRKYTKRASEYWDEVIKTKRRKKQGISYLNKGSSAPTQTQESVTTSAPTQTQKSLTTKTKKKKEKQKKSQKRKK